jgi:hypothetical protein
MSDYQGIARLIETECYRTIKFSTLKYSSNEFSTTMRLVEKLLDRVSHDESAILAMLDHISTVFMPSALNFPVASPAYNTRELIAICARRVADYV